MVCNILQAIFYLKIVRSFLNHDLLTRDKLFIDEG